MRFERSSCLNRQQVGGQNCGVSKFDKKRKSRQPTKENTPPDHFCKRGGPILNSWRNAVARSLQSLGQPCFFAMAAAWYEMPHLSPRKRPFTRRAFLDSRSDEVGIEKVIHKKTAVARKITATANIHDTPALAKTYFKR